MPVDNKFELLFTASDHGGKTEIIQLSCDNVNAPRKLAPCRLANPRLQVDSQPVPLLADAYALR